LIPNPIHKVLSTLSTHGVRALLMGGQACVLYGAAEFSRDTDIMILADRENLDRLRLALRELNAVVIAVPPCDPVYLKRGHAIHFRCRRPDVNGMRLDVMAVMRGVDDFPSLWARRTTVETGEGQFEVLALRDLIKAKKTQRDKDWPMIRRLVEADYEAARGQGEEERIVFWLEESRTPEMLFRLATRYPQLLNKAAVSRPFLGRVNLEDVSAIEEELKREEQAERAQDREYWKPLRAELERLRHGG